MTANASFRKCLRFFVNLEDKLNIMGKLTEYLLHDIPTYYGVNSPDGRIVGELRKQLIQDNYYQQKTQHIQNEMIGALQNIQYDMVNRNDFYRVHEKTHSILNNQLNALGNIYHAQLETNGLLVDGFNDTIDAININTEITGKGFTTIHQDLATANLISQGLLKTTIEGNEITHQLLSNANQIGLLQTEQLLQANLLQEHQNNIAAKGFEDVSNHLGRINSSVNRVGRQLHDDLSSIYSNIHFQGTETRKTIQEGIQTLKGLPFPRKDFKKVIQNPVLFFYALVAFSRNMLTKECVGILKNVFQQKIQKPPKTILENVEDAFEELLLEEEKPQRYEKKIRIYRKILYKPFWLLEQKSAFFQATIQFLIDYIVQTKKLKRFKPFLAEIVNILDLKEKASYTTIPKNILIAFANNGYLDNASTFHLKQQFREARLEGTQVDINFNLIEANEQRAYTNQLLNEQIHLQNRGIEQRSRANSLLSSILTTIRTETQNLQELTQELIHTAERGFHQVAQQLGTLNIGIENLTKVVAISQQSNLQELQSINASLNQKLDKLIDIQLNSLTNLARQRFENGQRAFAAEDYEDAFTEFTKGIADNATFIGNQLGAGLAAEKLYKISEAIRHFSKTANYAKSENPLLASIAYQKATNLYIMNGDLTSALSNIEKAIQNDSNNLQALYLKAQIFSRKLQYLEAVDTLYLLIKKKQTFIYTIRQDKIFANLNFLALYSKVYQNQIYTNERFQVFLMQEFLLLKDTQTAFAIFEKLLNPLSLATIQTQFWRHPIFDNILKKAQKVVNQHYISKFHTPHQNAPYAWSYLAFGLKLNIALIDNAFYNDMSTDPNFQNKNAAAIQAYLRKLIATDYSLFIKSLESRFKKYAWLYFELFLRH